MTPAPGLRLPLHCRCRSYFDSGAAEHLAQDDDIYEATVKVAGYHKDQIDPDGKLMEGLDSGYVWTIEVPVAWNEILQAVGPMPLHEASEPEIRKALFGWLKLRWKEDDVPEDMERQYGTTEVGAEIVEDVLVQFFVLGVIQRGVQRRTVSDRGKYWALTDVGQDQMMKLRAIRK